MIGHGRHHLTVPRDTRENLRFREKLLAECAKSERARRLVTTACRDDIIFWIDCFAWQTNPDQFGEEDGPFVCFPFQEEALLDTIRELFYNRQLVVWEKSRKQGGTVLALLLDVWLTTFHTRKRSLVMSHTEKAVEKGGDEDTLFGKVDFILKHLPQWMRDGLPRVRGVYRMKKTRSQIVGTSTTVRSGVGGRTSKVTGDEVSKWGPAAGDIISQLRDTAPVLAIGTHYGVGGTWFDLCKSPAVFKVVMHWSKNPMYNRGLYKSDPSLAPNDRLIDRDNPPPPDYPFVTDGSPHGGPYPGLRSPFYDYLCRTRPAREMAIHWDIDPAGAARQFFNVNMLRDYIRRYARPPEWEGDIEYEPNGRFKKLREREGGPLRLWVKPRDLDSPLVPSLYKVGGDIGAGTGATPSCLAGGDAMTGRKVLEYQLAQPPVAEPANFAKVAVAVCWLLKDPAGQPAQIVWDRTGPTGGKFGQAIAETGFRNFWYWRDEFTLNPKIGDTPGWFANPNSIRALLGDYNDALEKGLVENPSENSLKECLAFEYSVGGQGIVHGESVRTDDPAAGRLNHSDMAYADALMTKLMLDSGLKHKPEDRLGSVPAAEYGWNPDGPTVGWLMAQGRGGKDPFRR